MNILDNIIKKYDFKNLLYYTSNNLILIDFGIYGLVAGGVYNTDSYNSLLNSLYNLSDNNNFDFYFVTDIQELINIFMVCIEDNQFTGLID